jgi:hypothetical protein
MTLPQVIQEMLLSTNGTYFGRSGMSARG